MRSKPPKVPRSPGLPRYFSLGPQAAKGTYTARLIKGKKIYTGQIEVLADPVSAHGKKDRELRHQTVMKLYNLQEELAYIADSVNDISKEIEKRLEKIKNKKLKTQLKNFKTRLDKFHKTMLQHESTTAEEKLMGKVIELYSSVIQYGGKPTDSQLFHYSILQDQVKQAEVKFKRLIDKELPTMKIGE